MKELEECLNLSTKRDLPKSSKSQQLSQANPNNQLIKVKLTGKSMMDYNKLLRIVTLCNNLLARIEDSLNLERFAEDKRVEAYK